MHRAPSAALRIAVGGALGLALYLLAMPQSNPATVYAIDATPTPVIPGGAAAAPSQLQQTSDQITSVSQQITQAIQDPSTSADTKVQLINSLAAQFNQLVAIWQQQLAQTQSAAQVAQPVPTPAAAIPGGPACGTVACTQAAPPGVAGVQATPTPVPKPAA